jgi:hypothetical protein
MKIVLRRAAISEWSSAGSRSGPSEEYGAKRGLAQPAQPATSAPFAGYHGGSREGGKRGIVAIHPETAQCLRRQLYSDRVDWVLQKFSKQLKLEHGYSAHSTRATFITTALENDVKS